MENNIVQLTETYALQIFENDLPADLRYHDLNHTLSVRESSLLIGAHYKLSEENLEAMEIAALLHDTGYVKAYTGHEAVSAEIAENFLVQHNYPPERIELVKELIAATKLVYEPKNLMQKIIKDADLNNLGQGQYLKTIDNLRKEMHTFLNLEYSDEDFYEMNIQFMDNHYYFTDKAKNLFNEKKAKNRKKVLTELNNIKKNGQKGNI
jgi:HD superfamily phosphodiesterase